MSNERGREVFWKVGKLNGSVNLRMRNLTVRYGWRGIGTWRYNPTGREEIPGAFVRRFQVGSKTFEVWNRTARKDALTLPYARCPQCGKDNWEHRGISVHIVNRIGYPKISC